MNGQWDRVMGILNDQIVKESFMYDELDTDKPNIERAFYIQNDTLMVSIFVYLDDARLVRQYSLRSVCIHDIESLLKDYGIFFRTKPNAVTQTSYQIASDGVIRNFQTQQSSYFETSLKQDPKGYMKFKKKLLKAFEKAGHPISVAEWQ